MSQSLHFLRAFQLGQEIPFEGEKRTSQSLHFLRAFQQFKDNLQYAVARLMSQSLHFLRAFQQAYQGSGVEHNQGRNPFIFLGHFN